MTTSPSAERPVPWPHPLPGDHWHPEVRGIFNYWRARHPEHGLPGRQHLDPADVVRLLPGIWLLDVQRLPFRLRYRLVGTRIVSSIGREVTGLWMDEAHPDSSRRPDYFQRYERVVESGQPSWRRGRPQLWIHEDYTYLENLVLPLARDGRTVDMLLAFTGVHDTRPTAVPFSAAGPSGA
jgi:hypothetical protein